MPRKAQNMSWASASFLGRINSQTGFQLTAHWQPLCLALFLSLTLLARQDPCGVMCGDLVASQLLKGPRLPSVCSQTTHLREQSGALGRARGICACCNLLLLQVVAD